MTVKDIILGYLGRAKVKISSKELARVLGLNYNTTRKVVGELKREKILTKGERSADNKLRFEFVEKAEQYVIKYLSTLLYCGTESNSHHGNKKEAHAYTFEIYPMKDVSRADDLYEAIRAAKETKFCHEIDLDLLDGFGRKYGYGVEPRKRIEDQYIYPNIAISIDGRKVQ